MRRQVFCALTAITFCFGVAACGSKSSGSTGAGAGSGTGATGAGATGAGASGTTGSTGSAMGGAGGTGGTTSSSGSMSTGTGGNGSGTGVDLLAAGLHVCVQTKTNNVYCWGNADNGDLGQSLQDNQASPVKVAGLSGLKQISSGGYVTCFIGADDALSCFGANDEGQLGGGSADGDDHPMPAQVMTDVAQVQIGRNVGQTVCAVKKDGTLWCWGANGAGQLGSGMNDSDPHPTPAQVPGVSNVKQVSVFDTTVCALEGDGSVWCWGSGVNGKLGVDESTLPMCTTSDGSPFGCLTSPAKLPGAPAAKKVVVGGRTTHVIAADGSVWGCGENGSGDLGLGNDTAGFMTGTVPGFTAVDLGSWGLGNGDGTCAIKADGTVWCWGSDYADEIAEDFMTVDHESSPKQVQGLPGAASAIDVNGVACVVMKADGSLWCWGDNGEYELGTGDTDTTSEAAPVQVTGLQ
jgi:hypothetical protein